MPSEFVMTPDGRKPHKSDMKLESPFDHDISHTAAANDRKSGF